MASFGAWMGWAWGQLEAWEGRLGKEREARERKINLSVEQVLGNKLSWKIK
jgi:hypothetical protein